MSQPPCSLDDMTSQTKRPRHLYKQKKKKKDTKKVRELTLADESNSLCPVDMHHVGRTPSASS